MKANKIIYWTSTIIFAGFFLMSAGMYFSQNPELVKGMAAAGYPPYMLAMLGTAKLLGAIALVQPKFKTLKEWAYAGFTINLIGAVWTHVATNTPFVSAVVFLVVLAVSYVSWKRLESVKEYKPAFA